MILISKSTLFDDMLNYACMCYETDEELEINADHIFGQITDSYRKEYGEFELDIQEVGDKLLTEWYNWAILN